MSGELNTYLYGEFVLLNASKLSSLTVQFSIPFFISCKSVISNLPVPLLNDGLVTEFTISQNGTIIPEGI